MVRFVLDSKGKEVLRELGELPSRNISVRVMTSVPSVAPNSTDLKILEEKGLELYLFVGFISILSPSEPSISPSTGVQVRKVDFGRLTQGVLHSKFWIVDRKHLLIGSANMDWRAVTQVQLEKQTLNLTFLFPPLIFLTLFFLISTKQVKELGVVFYNCSSLAQDLYKIFESYWVMGESNSTLPRPWPPQYDTDINKQRPLLVKTENVSSSIYLSVSFSLFVFFTDEIEVKQCV